MGHKRIKNKRIKEILNDISSDDKPSENSILTEKKEHKGTKHIKLQLDQAQK